MVSYYDSVYSLGGINMMKWKETIIIDTAETLINKTLNLCNAKIIEVTQYLLGCDDCIIREANYKMINDLRKELSEIFGKLQILSKYLKNETLKNALNYIEQDFTIISESEISEEEKYEEICEMLIEVPISLSKMLNLDIIKELCYNNEEIQCSNEKFLSLKNTTYYLCQKEKYYVQNFIEENMIEENIKSPYNLSVKMELLMTA